MEYNRNDLPRKVVRSINNATCKVTFESLGITQMTTAYSWTKNIRSIVTKAKLDQAPGKRHTNIIRGELSAIW